MRELKFRVWDNHTKRYATFIYETNKDCYLFIGLSGYVTAFNCYGEEIDFEDDRFVIQQYTGLKDYKGNEIYEGDILEELINNETKTHLGVCKHILGGWKIFSLENSSYCYHGWKKVIVGNIFETPELIKNNE